MIKIKKHKLSVIPSAFIIVLISVFLFSSCKSDVAVNVLKPISAQTPGINIPGNSNVDNTASDSADQAGQDDPGKDSNIKNGAKIQSNVKDTAKITTGQGSNAQTGAVAIKDSDVKGVIINKPGGQKSADAAGKESKKAVANKGTGIQHAEGAAVKPVEHEKYKEYKVVLGADAKIKIPGTPGKLRVWIGIPEYKPDFSAQMAQATGSLPAVGVTAKVTPVAPAFKVEPKESMCMKIHPTGSEVGFTLTPIEEGTFEVGADVKLYDSNGCSGTPIPKATSYLQVQVVVDHAKELKKHTRKFEEVFWEKLLNFWGGILAIFFALLLFLSRKHLKRWFGFEEKK